MSNKPTIPQGTRDFNANTVQKRNYIFNVIRNIFELYGFQPLETPALENLDTLMGKYGEEGDKLIFKILNNGLENPAKKEQAIIDFDKILAGKNNKGITERALRYDLTIPFARFVAMNYGSLVLPFKRYQIQPVWRADRPQKGRYREFYQCDADVVGSNSLLNELELTAIYHAVFDQLNLPVEIRVNNRKILAALAEISGGADQLVNITVAIDKLDKIGIEKVKEELELKGLNEAQIATIEQYLSIRGSNEEKLEQLALLLGENKIGEAGIAEITYLLNTVKVQLPNAPLRIDLTLARGLNYYTGIIFEIKAIGAQMGSIGGGGRYDNLTGLFGVPNIPGVGISFGVDRIYDVLEELQLFSASVNSGTKILFFNLGTAESARAYTLMQGLRARGIASELYHEQAKFDKQFKYAEKKNIPQIIIIGSSELADGTCTIKQIQTGEQQTVPQVELCNQVIFN